MHTSTVQYIGALRTQAHHTASGETITTDAPLDNNGRGQAFSPTDLLATSLASCMFTVMGIAAQQRGIGFSRATATVEKIMLSNPRRVGGIHIEITICDRLSEREKILLERVAQTCPVAKSLSAEIQQMVRFRYEE